MSKTIITFFILLIIITCLLCSKGSLTMRLYDNSHNETPFEIKKARCDPSLGKSDSPYLYVLKVKKSLDVAQICNGLSFNLLRERYLERIKYCTIECYSLLSFDEIGELEKNPMVLSVERVTQYYLMDAQINDPAYPIFQSPIDQINCSEAWNYTMGSPEVEIVIIDTGVNGLHSEFDGKIIDGWAYVNPYGNAHDDILPYNVNWDEEGHGTHIAGIASAIINNGIGIAGICPECLISAYKVSGGCQQYFTWDGVYDAIIDAANRNVNGTHRVVINCSFGNLVYSTSIQDAIEYAVLKGAIVVAAMGNEYTEVMNFPAGYNGVIAVGAVNGNDTLASFSTGGGWISVTAPGVDILSCYNLDDYSYSYRTGTSMATPFVVGLCALLLSKDLSLTPHEVKSIVEDTADDLGEQGFDNSFGWGRINVGKALASEKKNYYGALLVGTMVSGMLQSNITVTIWNNDTLVAISKSSTGGITGVKHGYAHFLMLRTGTYLVKCSYGGGNLSQEVTVSVTNTLDNPYEIEIDF